MTLRTFTITFTGSAQQLSSLLTTEQDVPVYAMDIQAEPGNANACYVGDSTVSTSNGIRIPVPVTSVPEAPYRIGDFGSPQLLLSDVYMIGNAAQGARILVFAQ
jgi:hypothetical protein